MDTKLTERAQTILSRLISHYIHSGQPVGSKTIAQLPDMTFSPATIRNIMAELEDAGLLHSPHTSAGRVPTNQAYRLFVENMVVVDPLNQSEQERLHHQLQDSNDTQGLIETASSLIASMTHLAGIVTLPRHEKLTLRHVEFLPLSGNRVLVILVLNSHEVQNRIINTDRQYTPSELEQAGNYLAQNFSGHDFARLHESVMQAMRQDQQELQALMQTVAEMTEKTFSKEHKDDYVVSGETHLLHSVDESDVTRLRDLFDAFNQKRDMLHLLERSLDANSLQIFIGQESGYNVLGDYSMVTVPYGCEGEPLGVLGVVGPTRMPYDRVISVVDITAKLLGAALNSKDGTPR